MYSPAAFNVHELSRVYAFIEANGFATLISQNSTSQNPDLRNPAGKNRGQLSATHLPFLLSEDKCKIYGHIARENPQHKELENDNVLVIFQGPHGYISPSWYTTPGVPTWNYQAVHIYGRCKLLNSSSDTANIIEALTRNYEARMEKPWTINYPLEAINFIVGFEIDIQDIQCKFKLSQNRPMETEIT